MAQTLNYNLPKPKELLLNIVRSMAQLPDSVEIEESETSTVKGESTQKRIRFRIVCDKTDAGFIVGDNGGIQGDRSGAVLRGIRAIFRNIGRYEDAVFDIDMADSVKAFRPVRENVTKPRTYQGMQNRG